MVHYMYYCVYNGFWLAGMRESWGLVGALFVLYFISIQFISCCLGIASPCTGYYLYMRLALPRIDTRKDKVKGGENMYSTRNPSPKSPSQIIEA